MSKSAILLKSVSSSQLFEPLDSLPGQLFVGLRVRVQYEVDGQDKNLSFTYPYITDRIDLIASQVVSAVLEKNSSKLPEGVAYISANR